MMLRQMILSMSIQNLKKEDHVWPIMREENPGCEWTKNDEIVGSIFPFLF